MVELVWNSQNIYKIEFETKFVHGIFFDCKLLCAAGTKPRHQTTVWTRNIIKLHPLLAGSLFDKIENTKKKCIMYT